ncbi:MAG: NAD(P)-binding protein [Actinophytocola sp.]|nr:NAD(P)-binding protein [Actinophytocola sp.]MPZ85890.1 NAD(P)-binding protein [Actinophytocola sp.]
MRIAVVCAGVIGLATADALRRRGAEVVCLEADTIPSGC